MYVDTHARDSLLVRIDTEDHFSEDDVRKPETYPHRSFRSPLRYELISRCALMLASRLVTVSRG